MGNYNRTSVKDEDNKIIPMNFDAKFYFERALVHLDRNNLSKALKYFWKTVDVEPKNPVHYCNIAGLLSELGRYKESNELLIYVVEKLDSDMTECYYYLANNYANMEELESSFKYIHRYLEVSPEGEYANEAIEMKSYIAIEIEEISGTDDEEKELYITHYNAKSFLEEGKFYEAIKKLKELVESHPEFVAARNNLALAYFYIGKIDKAIEESNTVLEKESTNIHAMCNLANFYQHLNAKKDFNNILNMLRKIFPFQKDHQHKLATTFAILGDHEMAFKHLKYIIQKYKVFNPSLLHYGAVAAFNMKQYSLAQKWWERINKYDIDEDVSEFYLNLAIEIEKKDNNLTLPIYCYQYSLPFEELINQLKLNPEQNKNIFTLASFNWGLEHGDEKMKEQIVLGLALVKDDDAEKILRDFLIDNQQSLSLKKKALIALEGMNAEPPYIMEKNGKIIEMNRQTPELSVWKDNWIEILDLIEKNMSEKYNVIELYDAKTLWYEFISKTHPNTPLIRKTEGWVAALEYVVAKMHQKSITIEKLVDKYGVSKQTISKNVKLLDEVLHVNKKIKNTYSAQKQFDNLFS